MLNARRISVPARITPDELQLSPQLAISRNPLTHNRKYPFALSQEKKKKYWRGRNDSSPDVPTTGVEASVLEDSDSAGASLELSPDDLSVPSISTATPSPQPQPTPSPQPPSTQHHQQSGKKSGRRWLHPMKYMLAFPVRVSLALQRFHFNICSNARTVRRVSYFHWLPGVCRHLPRWLPASFMRGITLPGFFEHF